ncbi:MAG: aminomethyl-transferring glycine dehydrogenase subunit GcvPA [Candidatus Thalassarchaeaceae archaeon]|nr:aminomethyl-transferring glycine dehydrogenase subunit GcvPA [Candidatus Thalassarchaeaceae archaeon]MDP7043558.1 aminomethyl-transferring glycine dehydrogenase subunit GcvPA [Candidatus Thalassarchaeaceae archaeon]
MVDHLPNLGREAEMLQALGLSSMDDLFSDIPESIKRVGPLDLPPPQTEEEIWEEAQRLLSANVPINSRPNFLGAGLYENFVPSMVAAMATRGEFLTAYTPYQPEVSQGMLQALWEFQTMISELVALPVSNVSVYDASTAAAEALTCATRVNNRKAEQKNVVYVTKWLPEHRLSVIENYTAGGGIEIRTLDWNDEGMIDLVAAESAVGSCAVYVEQPNPFGIIDENLPKLKQIIGENCALIVGVNATSLGLLEAPGNWGADIVVGEGQPFGIGATAGGPIYGLFACTEKYLRQMPGRIVGQTIDDRGNDAFTLTLSTREQHIRRHKATSNICSNETLIALMGSMHMALLGPIGLERLALRNAASCQVVRNAVLSLKGVELLFPNSSSYNEFTVVLPGSAKSALSHLDSLGVTGGLALEDTTLQASEKWLHITATDQTTEDDVVALVEGLKSWISSFAQEVEA